MEIYVPYIVCSGISTFLGKVAYNYYYDKPIIDDNNDEIEKIEYGLLDQDLYERKVSSEINRKKLGVSLKEKILTIQKICKEECGRNYPINNTKKVRSRWLRYINEYEKIGHSEFVYNHTSSKSNTKQLKNRF